MNIFRIIVVVLLLGAVTPLSGQMFPSKKLIELGWDIPNTAYLKANHESMQQTTPFDGVMLALEAKDAGGKTISSQEVMDGKPWNEAWFETAVADLAACKFTTFTDNFIRFNFSPGELQWGDADGWKVFCEKTALCAKIAKRTGLKGLAVDFEAYGKQVFQFDPKSGLTFDAVRGLVRERGRQWMQGIATEYPDMVLFTLFIADVNLQAGRDTDPPAVLEQNHYGLLPAFFNGMLDVAPPELRIVDGCETGYYLNGIDEFSRRSLAIQSIGGPAIRLVAPENRRRYVNQVQVGFGIYLDMYTNSKESPFYRGPKEGGTRLDRLEENFAAALQTTDEYVWIYGERYRWWKPTAPETQWERWENALPGVSRRIELTAAPMEVVARIFAVAKKTGTLQNVVKNAGFSESQPAPHPTGDPASENRIVSDWGVWQDKPLGTFTWDGFIAKGSAKASKVAWGCFMQSFPVKPSEYYFVSLDAKKQGVGRIALRIRWQDADGKWIYETEDRSFIFGTRPTLDGESAIEEGWTRASGVVKIPPEVATLQIQAVVRDQETETDAAWFKNAVLFRVE